MGVIGTNLAIERGPHIVHIPSGSFPCDAVGQSQEEAGQEAGFWNGPLRADVDDA